MDYNSRCLVCPIESCVLIITAGVSVVKPLSKTRPLSYRFEVPAEVSTFSAFTGSIL